MTDQKLFDVIIIGGSYSGLAAGMALGRAMRSVLIMDNGEPCNRQTPHSHNFLTHDGHTPAEIAAIANLQVRNYPTVEFFDGKAIHGEQTRDGFLIRAASGKTFTARQLVFATGIRDLLAPVSGLQDCWGISVLHCPFCHGYEVRNEMTGILSNGETGYEFSRLISNWTSDLTLYTNGPATLSETQLEKLKEHGIRLDERAFERVEHEQGYLNRIIFKNGTTTPVRVIYAPAPFEQHSLIPALLGCDLTEDGYIRTDGFQETTVKGVYAVGDNASRMRTVANAVATGTTAGMNISKRMIQEDF